MKKISVFLVTLVVLLSAFPARMLKAETAPDAKGEGRSREKTKTLKEVTVTAKRADPKSPFLADAQGTKIYAGKKTSVVHREQLSPVTNNNYRQALAKQPGLLLAEETTPLFSLGYRGLNPDRAQFMQVMKDGIPIVADIFGYPEAYYTPLLQTVDRIEFIRGGSALMYGPQPGGALNYVTKPSPTEKKFETHSENVFGTDDYFSTYETVGGSLGPLGYLGYIHERQGDGFRTDNSDFEVISGGAKMILNQTGDSRLTLNYDEYHEEHGEPGGLSLTTTANTNYNQNRDFATRLYDRFILERSAGSLTFEKEFSEATQLDFKTFGGRYRRWSKRQRGGGFGTVPTGGASGTNDIQEQFFYNFGFEPRFRHNYEMLGEKQTLAFGTFTYFSYSPREERRGESPWADDGLLRKESRRSMSNLSFFLEHIFRWKKLSVTPGFRLEHLWQRIKEIQNLDKAAVPLTDDSEFDFVPLFGLGIVYEVFKGLEVYSNISQSYRPKLFAEAVPLGTNETVSGDLREGSARQYDFGLRGRPAPFFSWDIDYFLLSFKDQIGTVGSTVRNVGDALHQGMELSTEVDLIGAYDYIQKTEQAKQVGSISPFVALSLLDAEFTRGPNDGNEPQYTPPYNLRFGLYYHWRDRVKISLLSTYVGDHFADDAKTANRRIPSYKVWDLTAEINLWKNALNAFDLSVFGGINNLFDEEYYTRITSTGIDPAYERNVYGGVKIDLG